ncbi:MAG: recombination protein RecR, partial [Actinomycetia bacterium]|nr:recombination protein RecR [Actinomycetes bacterium]
MKSNSLNLLVDEFSKLPGIGRKTARRLAFHIIKVPGDQAKKLSQAIIDVKEKIKFCKVCGYITEEELCIFCRSDERDRKHICIVENLNGVISIEKTGSFKGLYHVLGGLIAPTDGVGPSDIRLKELAGRIKRDNVTELLIAVPHTMKGDTTVFYMQKLFSDSGISVKFTRIAAGIPFGGDLEYIDRQTLLKSIEG